MWETAELDIRKLRDKTGKPVVFCGNGRTCRKSYDAGVAAWAKAKPDRAVLLGRSPIRPEDFISHDVFKARLLDPGLFQTRANTPTSVVLDIRDRVQRDTALFPFHEQHTQAEETARIGAVVERVNREQKRCSFTTPWASRWCGSKYYLESKRLKIHFFMKGGAQGY